MALAFILPATAILRYYLLPVPVLEIAAPVLLVWALVIMHLLGWLPLALGMLDNIAISFGETRVSAFSVMQLMLLVAVAFIFAIWLAEVINRQVARMPGVTPSIQVGVAKISRFLLLTLAFLLALNAVGINLSSLAIFGGALGVGLGFGLQRIASNFISGFILVLDRSIKPGDVITVGDKFGWVQELNARYIVVRNREGVDTLIPNENLIISEVINWSYADTNVRLSIPVQISYDDDVEKAMALLLECAKASPRVLENPPPTVRLTEFADSGIELQVRAWIADPVNGFAPVKSDINVAIWRAFKDNGITIPFPQRDVHIKSMPEPTSPESSAQTPLPPQKE